MHRIQTKGSKKKLLTKQNEKKLQLGCNYKLLQIWNSLRESVEKHVNMWELFEVTLTLQLYAGSQEVASTNISLEVLSSQRISMEEDGHKLDLSIAAK